MKIVKRILTLYVLFFASSSWSQSIQGIVLDADTNLPIESAAIYFDNTSIGTSTNNKGEFEIALKEGISSPLVVSFLGYEKFLLESYEPEKYYKILLKASLDTLDEVVISANDGMPRDIKLEQFRQQFLGFSKNAKSCTILNEDDLILRYKKSNKTLSASARIPIRIRNEALQYLVHFDIKLFEIEYSYVDVQNKEFNIKGVSYTGTTFYKSLVNDDDKRIKKKREEAYKGSVLHFMRALADERIEAEDFEVFSSGFKVNPDKYIFIRDVEGYPGYVNVSFIKPLNILYKRKRQSALVPRVKEFMIDPYGSYSPLTILFGGDMGDQRVGDLLPFDFILPEKN